MQGLRLGAVCLLSLVIAGLADPLPAAGNTVMIQATDVQLVRNGDVVTVTGRVHVRNWGFAPLTGLAIIGPEDGPLKGQAVYVGVVPSEGDAVSDGVYSFDVDTSKTPLVNIMIPVTVQYSLDGEQVEVSGGLSHTIWK